ncbi:MAG: hypothetical protein ACYTHK_02750 [Planctomycetota bacterium]|jgi:hypothetical protein
MSWTLCLLLAALARPVKDAPMLYAGPVWQTWRADKALLVRTNEGRLAREVTLPKGHLFELVLGDGTVVSVPKHRKFATLQRPDGTRKDHAPFVWRKPTRVLAAYRDGMVVQPENDGVGHLFFVPWKGDKRIRLTEKEPLLDPAPILFRHKTIFASNDWTYDFKTRVRVKLKTPKSADFLFDGRQFVARSRGFALIDGVVYSIAEKDGIRLVAGTQVAADFRVPEGGIKRAVSGRGCYSFRPKERGWRHVIWPDGKIRYWDGKQWSLLKQAERKSQ